LTELHFLGGCKTIGSSAYLVKENATSILSDFGASFNGHPTFPPMTRPKNLTVALSHAHLDHSGGLPLLFTSGSAPVYMTAITRDIIRVLLKDMLRLSRYFLPYEKLDVERLFRRIKIVNYKEPVDLGNGITLTLFDAGHIPGSAAIHIQTPSIPEISTPLIPNYKVLPASPQKHLTPSSWKVPTRSLHMRID
jgi:putative mRNA 3-end processing factor